MMIEDQIQLSLNKHVPCLLLRTDWTLMAFLEFCALR